MTVSSREKKRARPNSSDSPNPSPPSPRPAAASSSSLSRSTKGTCGGWVDRRDSRGGRGRARQRRRRGRRDGRERMRPPAPLAPSRQPREHKRTCSVTELDPPRAVSTASASGAVPKKTPPGRSSELTCQTSSLLIDAYTLHTRASQLSARLPEQRRRDCLRAKGELDAKHGRDGVGTAAAAAARHLRLELFGEVGRQHAELPPGDGGVRPPTPAPAVRLAAARLVELRGREVHRDDVLRGDGQRFRQL